LKKPEKIACWTVSTGADRLPTKEELEVIKKQEGLVGAHPHYPLGLFWLFKSLECANTAKNNMENAGIHTGSVIKKVLVESKYVKLNRENPCKKEM